MSAGSPAGTVPGSFEPDEAWARRQDEADPLGRFRDRFHIPTDAGGRPRVYLCGNSLGLQPRAAGERVAETLAAWAERGVEGHFEGAAPWYAYHESCREPLARLVGARPDEVVAMNGLTTNLHLMMVSFYRPTGERHAVLMEDAAFPSDTYAVRTQIRFHGHDPGRSLIVARPREGETCLRTGDIEELIERHAGAIALVLLGGVNYYSGQAFDMRRITACARRHGAAVGLDLAHAAGNLVLELHDWGADFAVWCSYKYLNAGPGAVAGSFVHERHHGRSDLPRLGGWWGNDPARRFRMHLEPEFVPVAGADGWQLSNPPILALAPLRASLELFDEAGVPALRAKSERLTAYLEGWIDRAAGQRIVQVTPRDPASRGCQLSLLVPDRPRELLHQLEGEGAVVDYREPDVLRAAPVPLYNSFHDVWRFGQALRRWAAGPAAAGA